THTRFRLWAPDAKRVDLDLLDGTPREMPRDASGWYSLDVECGAGTRYRFRIDDELNVPDPASRAQAEDVHSPSVVVDPDA
ncbi:malto-oligosyltrehalose trehalohydrolase, partial [Escherichia coli]|nr:malto-oligosyltrehalose trehalohydrolase [Escherichia coli]